jgi:hypothetical protein
MEDNNIKHGVEQLMAGLDLMVAGLEKNVTEAYSKMGKDEAIEFKKAMEKSNINSHVEDLTKNIKDLKVSLNVK